MVILRSLRAAAIVASFLVTAVAFSAEQPGNASGSVTVNGKATALHHAYAFHDAKDNTTRVLITDRALDAAMLAEEGGGESQSDKPSFRALTKQGQAAGVKLLITKSGDVETVTVYHKVFGMPTPTTGPKFWFEPYRLSGGLIGGRSRSSAPESFFKDIWEYNVTFLTSVGEKGFDIPAASAIAAAHKANDAREKARVLPAGGGEEGTMYLSYRRNLEGEKSKALLDQMTASMKNSIVTAMHASSPLTESTLGSWAFMKSMPAGKVEVVGGVRDPEGTTLELQKTLTTGGRKVFGTALLVKEQAAWKIASENW